MLSPPPRVVDLAVPAGTLPDGRPFPGSPPLTYQPLPGRDPPIGFMPGDPVPPDMPPAWCGGRLRRTEPFGSLRPPFPWEPLMICPRWNPAEWPGWPTLVPNPHYDPKAVPPPGTPYRAGRTGPFAPPARGDLPC